MKKIVFTALLLIFALLLASCGIPTETPTVDDGENGEKIEPKNRMFYEYFDTVCVFYDYTGGTEAEFKELYTLVEAELKACHELFDIYHTYAGVSNVKTVNDMAGGEPIKVDQRFIDLLEFSKDMYAKTSGNVNVMMGAVLSIWHNHRGGIDFCCDFCDFDGRVEVFGDDARTNWNCPECGVKNETQLDVPSAKRLTSASAHTDINSLEINKDDCTVRIIDPNASLDLGAVAKGYTCERISQMLEERGVFAYALDFGGNLRVGEKLSGEGWKSAIKNPDIWADDPYIKILDVKNAALVTSGSYERFYTVDGVRYHHIINKDTLMPENRYTSVSILTPTSGVADALSTAFFNMTEEEILQTLKVFASTEVTLVYPDGRVEVLGANA